MLNFDSKKASRAYDSKRYSSIKDSFREKHTIYNQRSTSKDSKNRTSSKLVHKAMLHPKSNGAAPVVKVTK